MGCAEKGPEGQVQLQERLGFLTGDGGRRGRVWENCGVTGDRSRYCGWGGVPVPASSQGLGPYPAFPLPQVSTVR